MKCCETNFINIQIGLVGWEKDEEYDELKNVWVRGEEDLIKSYITDNYNVKEWQYLPAEYGEGDGIDFFLPKDLDSFKQRIYDKVCVYS